MKPINQALERLLRAAAKAAPETAAAPTPGFEIRVLANWRASWTDDDSVSLFAILRHAAVCAALVLVLSAAWSLIQNGASPAGDEAARLDYDIQTSLAP
jgi:hypothetical protein